MPKTDLNLSTTVEIGATLVRPGDILIVALSRQFDQRTASEYRERVMGRLPGLADVVVLPDVTALVTYRPDGADE